MSSEQNHETVRGSRSPLSHLLHRSRFPPLTPQNPSPTLPSKRLSSPLRTLSGARSNAIRPTAPKSYLKANCVTFSVNSSTRKPPTPTPGTTSKSVELRKVHLTPDCAESNIATVPPSPSPGLNIFSEPDAFIRSKGTPCAHVLCSTDNFLVACNNLTFHTHL